MGLIRNKSVSNDYFSNSEILPHSLVFALNMLLMLLYANADVNSRVASTCPFYYWAAAVIINEDSRN